MKFKSKSGKPAQIHTACLILGVFAKGRLSDAAALVDQATSGVLGELVKDNHLDGESGQTLMLQQLPGIAAKRVLLVGCGKAKEYNLAAHRKAMAAALDELSRQRLSEALSSLHEPLPNDADHYRTVRDDLLSAAASVYRFDQLKSDPKAPKHPLKTLTFFATNKIDQTVIDRAIDHGAAIASGMKLAKDLGNLPGNVCTPSYLADQAHELAARSERLKVSVLEEKDMQKLGMGALLAVSRGSRQPAKLIVMNYQGGKKKDKPVVLVGKGLTFDAGGISIKPGEAMDEMKYDMCGGASVFGTVRACLDMQLPINLVGVVPASENLPDGDANKPGDILTSMSGQTIEVLNTDAEGRLILCDALTYSRRFEPAVIIDIATLTGACVVALGKHASGLFSNDDALARNLLECGERSGDRAWQLPLWDDYQSQLDSRFADMANIGGRAGGSITAACFLSRFTKELRWAHLDIAGSAWLSGDKKGSTGRPVPMLTEFLLQQCSGRD